MRQLRRRHCAKRHRGGQLYVVRERAVPGGNGPDKLRLVRRWVLNGGSDFGSDGVHNLPCGVLQQRPRDVVFGVPHRNVLRRGGVVLLRLLERHL